MGTLVTTYRCNERCLMCDLPFRAESSDGKELTTAEWHRVIDEMIGERTSGIGITGGEPLLRQDTADLVVRIRRKGLPVTVNTNGLLLNNPKILDPLLAADPTNINISVDATTPSLHDHLRGLEGSWELLVKAVDKLMERRQKTAARTKVTAVCVLSPHNVSHLDLVLETCEKLGFDAVGFMPIHEIPAATQCHGEVKLVGLWDDASMRRKSAEVADAVETLVRRRSGASGIRVDNSRTYLEMMPLAYLGQKAPIECVAGYASSFVDPYGNVYPCLPFLEWKREPIGNVRQNSWKELWRSARYQEERKVTAGCRECFWNCQMELNVLFRKPDRNGLQVSRQLLSRTPVSSLTPESS
jgi:MoaA/NifB/PqqE/SkfB family radical SAM enzyme